VCPPWRAPVGYNAWMTTDPPASWRTPTEALRVVLHLEHLKGTLLTAAVVGTVLFAINQLDTVLGGQATTATWVKTGITYLVPFCVANIGLLVGTHRSRG